MRALLFFSIFLLIPSFVAADECHIDSEIWFTTDDEAMDEYLCILEWSIVSIESIPLSQGSDDGETCKAIVELIGDADKRLETLISRDDGNSQLYHAGHWSSMIEFEKAVLERGCSTPI